MKESPLFWPAKLKGTTLYVLDETLLPKREKYIAVKDTTGAVRVIRTMKTRAFGQFLVVMNTFLLVINTRKGASNREMVCAIEKTAQALNKSRPTFPFAEITGMVAGWAREILANQEDVAAHLTPRIAGFLSYIRAGRLRRVEEIAALIKNGDSILTHCNVSGELAMAAALCEKQGKKVWFFATETRPYFQGARLTCWELQKAGANVTLIADNAVGTLLSDKVIDKVIVGSDRSCANGDFANKIGTYQIAVLAKAFKVPMYVLLQPSKKIKRGEDIPIEIRNEKELIYFNGKRLVPKGARGLYPSFDVIPCQFVKKPIVLHVN